MALAVESPALTSRAAAEAYLGGVCFKLGPPTLIGAELEWLTTASTGDDPPARTGRARAAGVRPSAEWLARALGPHAPRSVAAQSPSVFLSAGSAVTIEPGGQVEISSAPHADLRELCRSLDEDAAELAALLSAAGLRAIDAASDTGRRARRILQHPRYRAMEALFARNGPFGALMMCNTAAVQVSVDAGADAAEVAARWQMLNDVGPALVAAFADSPALHGIPAGDWASQRMRTWLELDRARTQVRPTSLPDTPADPTQTYARWALEVPLLCVVDDDGTDWQAPPGAGFGDWIDGALDDEVGRRPTRSDLDYHLTTLFPPVRARGHLEVRYLDAQPPGRWHVPIAVVAALASTPTVVAEATRRAAPVADRWEDAARCGVRDPQVGAVAAELLDLAAEHATDTDFAADIGAAAQRVRAGRRPSEEDR